MPIDRELYMDAAEAKRLLRATKAWAITDQDRGARQGVIAWAVVDTVMGTGLRVSELARITVGDFNAGRKSLRICRSKKKKAVTETLAIGPELARHLRQFIAWKKTVGESTDLSAALFCGNRGPYTKYGMMKVWKAAIREAGLPKAISIKSARHTLAIHLLKRTKHLRQVQAQLGHASPATTANMYAGVLFDEMQDGVTGLYAG